MPEQQSSGRRIHGLLFAAALVFLTGLTPVRAETAPEWVASLPVGSSLSAGIGGFVVDAAGVSYATGTSGPSFNNDVTTVAWAPDGTLLWSDTWNGGGDWHDAAHDVDLAGDGTLWVTGSTPDPNKYADVMLLQYDAATGALLTEIDYTRGPFLSESGRHVAADGSAVFVAGSTVGDGGDALILKFDGGPVPVWTQVWDGPAFAPFSQDSSQDLELDPAGNPVVLIHGVMSSQHPDYVVVKYHRDTGAVLWESTWGVSGGDFPTDLEIDSVGDVYVTGTGIDFTDKYSTVKFRGSDGVLLWQEYDAAGLDDAAIALALDGQGGVIVTGHVDPDGDRSNFNDDFYTVRRDAATGAFDWSHRYGDPCVGCFDAPSDVAVDPAGRVYVAGSTSSAPYSGTVIQFVLDLATGVESDRGISDQGGTGFLRFDGDFDLFDGGRTSHPNTGEVEISAAKWTSRMTGLPTLEVAGFVAGGMATLTVTNVTPGATQYVLGSAAGLGVTPVPQLGVDLDLLQPRLLVSGVADASGTFEATVPVPPAAAGRTLWLEAAEDGGTTAPVFVPVP